MSERVKLTLDPMPRIIEDAKVKINEHFNTQAKTTTHVEQAHARKREIAQAVLNGVSAPMTFEQEAKLRGLTLEEFAHIIMAKGSTVDERELARQQMMMKVESCKSPSEVLVLMQGIGDGTKLS